jgi:DNA invertase Pin-like site-specific DNA recombinase
MTTTAVAYYRMSTDNQEESIPQQQGAMRPKAKLQGVEVLREFQDEGISGGRMAKRDAFKEMLAFCQEKHRQGTPVDAIVCWDTKRFSRASSIETNHYLWEFMEAGVYRLFTYSDGWIDFRREEHRVLFNLRQDISNNRDLRDRSRDVARGKLASHAAGWYNGGPPPYGFDRLVIDAEGNVMERVERPGKIRLKKDGWRVTLAPCERPEEIEVVRWLFQEFATTETSYRGLAHTLNTRGIPGPGSGTSKTPGVTTWGCVVVREMLKNPHYVGDYRYGHRVSGTYHRTIGGQLVEADFNAPVELRKDAPVLPDVHTGIIDRATWDRVQEKVRRRSATGERPRAKGRPLSGGLLRCGHCGAKMQGNIKTHNGTSGKVTYHYYICSGNKTEPGRCRDLSIREDKIIRCLVRKLQEEYLSPHWLDALRAKLHERLSARQAADPVKADSLERRLVEMDAEIRQGARNLLRATGNLDLIQQELTALREKREQLARELDCIKRSQAEDPVDLAAKIDNAVNRLRTLGDHLHKAKPEQLRAVFREMISRIDVYFELDGPRQRGQRYHFSRGVVKLRPQIEIGGYVSSGRARPDPSRGRRRASR